MTFDIRSNFEYMKLRCYHSLMGFDSLGNFLSFREKKTIQLGKYRRLKTATDEPSMTNIIQKNICGIAYITFSSLNNNTGMLFE